MPWYSSFNAATSSLNVTKDKCHSTQRSATVTRRTTAQFPVMWLSRYGLFKAKTRYTHQSFFTKLSEHLALTVLAYEHFLQITRITPCLNSWLTPKLLLGLSATGLRRAHRRKQDSAVSYQRVQKEAIRHRDTVKCQNKPRLAENARQGKRLQ